MSTVSNVVSRVYRGPVKAVIFDFAGTIVDYGSCAPVAAFQEVFKIHGVPIDAATARGPMGKNKRDHISEILYSPAVANAWKAAHNGNDPNEKDVDTIYEAFTPIQIETARQRGVPIPGAVDTIKQLRSRGIKIGGNSGYNTAIMKAVLEEAKKYDLYVDAMECAGPNNGRPKPWMSTRVAEALDVYPLASCIKVDDTLPGILEGLNSGMWTVGVIKSGNECGLSYDEMQQLEKTNPTELENKLTLARQRMEQTGAHYVIDSVADLLPIVDKINQQLEQGLMWSINK